MSRPAILCFILALSPAIAPGQGVRLIFDPAGPLQMGSGETIIVNSILDSRLSASSGGASAWSIAVRHDRGHFILDNVTLQGTSADSRGSDGFAFLEMVDDGVRAGFVSQVVLSSDGKSTLPAAGLFALARARYRGQLNFVDSGEASIRFSNDLPASSKGAVANSVRAGGTDLFPSLGELRVELTQPRFILGFDPPARTLLPGDETEVKITLTTSGNSASMGPSAWSISVAHDPAALELLSTTQEGTDIDQFGTRGIFTLTEPVANSTGNGFVSIAILNLQDPLALPPNGTAVIARARYRVKDGARIGSLSRVAFLGGLQGSGVVVTNHVDFIGGAMEPDAESLFLSIQHSYFVRGNVNGDGKINIADAIAILNGLFRGDSEVSLRCLDAADVTDDGKVNLTDSVYLLHFLFQSSVPPPEPFPQPGDDPTRDNLDCAEWP